MTSGTSSNCGCTFIKIGDEWVRDYTCNSCNKREMEK